MAITAADLSSQFDVLWNNVTSNQAPGLNIYEKSVFCTKALHQLLSEWFNHRTDTSDGGFDRSEKRHVDFSTLIDVAYLPVATTIPSTVLKIDTRSLMFNNTKTDILYMLNHSLYVPASSQSSSSSGTSVARTSPQERLYNVIPLSYDLYASFMRKPYKYPPKGCAWMLTSDSGYFEVIVKDVTTSDSPQYRLRYVKRPKPIILGNLTPYGKTIEDESNTVSFDFPEEMYQDILERAVTLAKIAWQGGTMTQAALNVQANK